MAQLSDVQGREFDWFFFDRSGRPGIAATGGNGPVPLEAMVVVDIHDALGATIEVVNWGTERVWQSYSDVGLYVYDWDDIRGVYVRLSTPSAPLRTDLASAIHNAEGIPTLNVDFASETFQLG